MREFLEMFALVKSSFNSFWKGDTTKLKERDIVSDEGFVLVPAGNRKRSGASNVIIAYDHEAKISRDVECNSMCSETNMAVSYCSLNTEINEAEMPSSMKEEVNFKQETSEVSPLEGVPFISTPYLKQVHDLLRDYPPVCPDLPTVNFDFSLEKAVLKR